MITETPTPATRYCNVCNARHPVADFYTYGGTGPSANRLRTYCKDAQKKLNAERRKRTRSTYTRKPAGLFTALL